MGCQEVVTEIQPTSLVVSSYYEEPRIIVYNVNSWITRTPLKGLYTLMMCNTFGVAIPVEISKKNIENFVHVAM